MNSPTSAAFSALFREDPRQLPAPETRAETPPAAVPDASADASPRIRCVDALALAMRDSGCGF